VFGRTPHDYRIHARLEEAKRLLARGDSVTEACFAVGASSLGTLQRGVHAARGGDAVGVPPARAGARRRPGAAPAGHDGGVPEPHGLPAARRAHAAIPEKRDAARHGRLGRMRIKLSSIFVDDQDKAERFYTQVLGFRKKHDIPVGPGARWLTMVSPQGPDDLELVLEPNGNPAAATYQKAIFDQGIPITAFETSDVAAEFARLKALGVAFTQEPTDVGPVTIAVLSDTCGNLLQLYQPKR
jgi:catechol 2,3-dioxygenase-like lactoylglutathione lyase family enzyme